MCGRRNLWARLWESLRHRSRQSPLSACCQFPSISQHPPVFLHHCLSRTHRSITRPSRPLSGRAFFPPPNHEPRISFPPNLNRLLPPVVATSTFLSPTSTSTTHHHHHHIPYSLRAASPCPLTTCDDDHNDYCFKYTLLLQPGIFRFLYYDFLLRTFELP